MSDVDPRGTGRVRLFVNIPSRYRTNHHLRSKQGSRAIEVNTDSDERKFYAYILLD